jgi:hypothetical protein
LGQAAALFGNLASLKADIGSIPSKFRKDEFLESLARELNMWLADVSSRLGQPMKTKIHHCLDRRRLSDSVPHSEMKGNSMPIFA